jgi:uncharacterized protein (DUF849 family)
VLLKAAINGTRGASDHPAVPVDARACAEDAVACAAAGAGAIHLHPRGPDGAETLEAVVVDEVVAAVREASQLPVGVSTGAWIEPDVTARVAAVHAWSEPDFASVNLSEEGALELMAALVDRGIGIEAGIFSVDDVERLVSGGMSEDLLRVLIEPSSEVPTEALDTARAVDRALDDAGVRAPRLGHGAGVATWSVLEWATAGGHDIRIGLEDTLVMADGSEAEDNAALVGAAAALLG